ncbi:Protein CBG23377 [Caenorhabditis briggsae]|uniref:Protein CBG23377 n=1 Tax=Caenorhabditis briggsae TaxID=6238 RepID=A8Y424_CAEBR|nr:Protein CBG23377 [Caenorhabditis briggsae]CAP39644.2 Protein CBG23377 [Caenorhabditis briggsae]
MHEADGLGAHPTKRAVIHCYNCMVNPDLMSSKAKFWASIPVSPWILEVVERGFEIILIENFKLPHPLRIRRMSNRLLDFVHEEVGKLLEAGVVVETINPIVCSPLQVADNGKKLRLILDLSALKKGIETPRFRLEDWRAVWPFLEKANYAATFDFKSGYHHIKIADPSSDLLAFSLEELAAAGVTVAEEKSFWSPSEQFTWLGIKCDLVTKSIRLTESREVSLGNQLATMKKSKAPTILDRQKLSGFISSMSIVEKCESVQRQRHLAATVARVTSDNPKKQHLQVSMSQSEFFEVEFWERKLKNGDLVRSINEEQFDPTWYLYTDASAEGMGAVLKNSRKETVWQASKIGDVSFRKESSALRELRAVEFATRTMREQIRGAISIHSDSQAAVSVLKKGSMKLELHKVAERVWDSVEQIRPARFLWIPREENTEADATSREFDTDDWGVQDWAFEWAQKRWSRVKCDLFASERNAKHSVYFSRYPEPTSSGTDAFDHFTCAANG